MVGKRLEHGDGPYRKYNIIGRKYVVIRRNIRLDSPLPF